jgi:probable F420-dependent oxidoreductase
VELGITVFLTDLSLPPAELGREVEERGFSSLWLPHHTHLPIRESAPPGLVEGVSLDDYKRGLDPIVALTAAATATKQIRLGTGVLLVAQLDPVNLAKQLATLDHLSGGRVVLGVGAGWNRAEAEDHGLAFAARRAVLREHLLCMKTLWRDDVAEFHGQHVDLAPCWSWPKPIHRRIPILVGGGATGVTWRAVCEYGDGWMPIGGAGLAKARTELQAAALAAGRDPPSLSITPFGSLPNAAKLAHFAELGVGEAILRVHSGSRAEILRQLDEHASFLVA